MASYFDRYQDFRFNSTIKPIPGLKIDVADTDKSIVYKLGDTRLDKVSNTYYNTPYYNWLILLANQQFGGLEFKIPDQSIIVIPFPFESAINRYIAAVNNYIALYGG